MAKKKVEKKVSKKQDDSKLFAFLAVFLTIIGFLIALLAKRKDKYVMFYAKQSLIIILAWIIAGGIMIIPIVGWITGPLLYALTFILWIITWINSLSGKQKDTWIIGDFAKKINL